MQARLLYLADVEGEDGLVEIIIQFLADMFVRIFPENKREKRGRNEESDGSRMSEVASYIKAVVGLLLFLVIGAVVIMLGANLLLSLEDVVQI